MSEKSVLEFEVLGDVGNAVGRSFGMICALPDELRAASTLNGKALPGINGDESWELPVPATFVIGPDRCVALAHVDVDYRRRLSPEDIVATSCSRPLSTRASAKRWRGSAFANPCGSSWSILPTRLSLAA